MTTHWDVPALPFTALGMGFLIGGGVAKDVLQLQLGGFWMGVAVVALGLWRIVRRRADRSASPAGRITGAPGPEGSPADPN